MKLSAENKPIAIASLFIVLILMIGTAYTLWDNGTVRLLEPAFILQQLQNGSYLGLCAAGLMVVILLGHIDLSIPWTLTAAAITGAAIGGPMAVPIALGVGLTVGLFNGLGVAYLRIPSMIFTLGVDTVLRGLMVAQTGGFTPKDAATPAMLFLAKGQILGIPVALLVWALVSLAVWLILARTSFGRSVYATGTREGAAYLSGIRTRGVIVGAFMLSGFCAALAGVLLAGYSQKAYQGMGNPYLLPAIAAVVLGGTHVLGGRGKYVGTLVGVMLIVLLNSVLSIMKMEEAWRQIIYGVMIIGMLLVYGRNDKVTQ